MKKVIVIDYAILGGSAITAINGGMVAYHAFKDKKWMGLAFGVLTIGVSVAAAHYALGSIKSENTATTTQSDKLAVAADLKYTSSFLSDDSFLKSVGATQNDIAAIKKLIAVRYQRTWTNDEKAQFYKLLSSDWAKKIPMPVH
jgi:hypothetical protein